MNGRQQMQKAIYMRDLARHQALVRGGTLFGDTMIPTSGTQADTVMATGKADKLRNPTFEVSSVYRVGSGAALDNSLMRRQMKRRAALMGLSLRAFMKTRRGVPLTAKEAMALRRVGGMSALVQYFAPQGIDIETAVEEGGDIHSLSAEEEALASEELGMSELEGEKMGFTTVLLIAGGVGLGLFLLGRAL